MLTNFDTSIVSRSEVSLAPRSRSGSFSSSSSVLLVPFRSSQISIDTFLMPGVEHTISLHDLFDVINRHRSLQHARILQADSYQKSNGRVTHRFIVLELERDGRERIWLRVDRRRDQNEGMLNFLARGAISPANDQVSFSVKLPV